LHKTKINHDRPEAEERADNLKQEKEALMEAIAKMCQVAVDLSQIKEERGCGCGYRGQ